MNHRPFEDWLLNDMPITHEQKRDLDLHTRTCASCSALVETGIALKSVKKVAPQAGFTTRFQSRLAERKLVERRRKIWGGCRRREGSATFFAIQRIGSTRSASERRT